MDITYQDVLEILRLVKESSCEEFHLETSDCKLIVRKRNANVVAAESHVGGRDAAPGSRSPTLVDAAGIGAPEGEAASGDRPGATARVQDPGFVLKAPMVGTFYRAPAPGALPFVDVGSVVTEDETVCIIEVMKLMNSVRAGCRGRVADICVENATMVEYSQPLMIIEALP